jgi:hypothetical protein
MNSLHFNLLAQVQQAEGPPMIFWIVYLGLIAVVIAGIWKVFTKAGEPGWACLIPIYNLVVLLRIAGMPLWWIILCFIPLISIIPAFVIPINLAEKFGKGAGFGIGLALLPFIFYPILGFGDAQYRGVAPAMAR